MKTTLKNLIYIALAFAIGVSINSACGDNLATQQHDNGNLDKTIASLQQEIEILNKRINNLETRQYDSFEVEGISFFKNGEVSSRKIEVDYNCPGSSTEKQNTKYEYDSYGRLINTMKTTTSINGKKKNESEHFEYSGKTVTKTYKTQTSHTPAKEITAVTTYILE